MPPEKSSDASRVIAGAARKPSLVPHQWSPSLAGAEESGLCTGNTSWNPGRGRLLRPKPALDILTALIAQVQLRTCNRHAKSHSVPSG